MVGVEALDDDGDTELDEDDVVVDLDVEGMEDVVGCDDVVDEVVAALDDVDDGVVALVDDEVVDSLDDDEVMGAVVDDDVVAALEVVLVTPIVAADTSGENSTSKQPPPLG